MQLRDNQRGVARKTRAQLLAKISTCRSISMPVSGKSANFNVVISVVEERVVVHRKREREMKERWSPWWCRRLDNRAKNTVRAQRPERKAR